jgi:biopolymer transport protein ExbD
MKRWNEQRDTPRGTNEVNLTPLIDVSLVLVVILLLATPLAFESSFALRRAAATARQSSDDSPVSRIEVTVLSADSVRVNRSVVAAGALGPVIEPLIERSVDGLVAVSCRDSVPHGAFVTALDVIKLSGARDIAVAGR